MSNLARNAPRSVETLTSRQDMSQSSYMPSNKPAL